MFCHLYTFLPLSQLWTLRYVSAGNRALSHSILTIDQIHHHHRLQIIKLLYDRYQDLQMSVYQITQIPKKASDHFRGMGVGW